MNNDVAASVLAITGAALILVAIFGDVDRFAYGAYAAMTIAYLLRTGNPIR